MTVSFSPLKKLCWERWREEVLDTASSVWDASLPTSLVGCRSRVETDDRELTDIERADLMRLIS